MQTKALTLALFLCLPALAAATEAPAAPASPVSLSAAELTVILAAPVGGAGVPAPIALSTCSATYTGCANGCPVTCTGTSTCSVGSNGVTCDGGFHGCLYPTCNPGPHCQTPEDKCAYCECRAGGGSIPECACIL
jgi:hypothetical protein